jgi:hypothetical protein
MPWFRKCPYAPAAGLLCLAAAAAGCASTPRTRLDDCRLRVQALQAENEQLRDVALNVRNENRDLATRAVEDARRLRAQDEAIRRLEQSVLAYQDERARMAALLDQIRAPERVARAAGEPADASGGP